MPRDPTVELAQAWLAKAVGDIAMDEAGLASPRAPGWAIAFHCQQAVEKSIKIQMVFAGVEPPHTHDLIYLYERAGLAALAFPLGVPELEVLHPFAVLERYPILTQRNIAREQVPRLVEFARQAVAWADAQVLARTGEGHGA